MTRRPLVLWILVMLGSAGAVGLSARAAADARREADEQLAQLRAAAEQVHEIARLRAASPAWTAKGPPVGGLTPRVSAALAAAGLPASALATLSPDKDLGAGGSSDGPKAVRRRATLTLAGLTLPQVGGFLAAWREREPEWTVSAIDVAPEPGKAPAQGGDLPLRTTITIEALYVEDAAAARGGTR